MADRVYPIVFNEPVYRALEVALGLARRESPLLRLNAIKSVRYDLLSRSQIEVEFEFRPPSDDSIGNRVAIIVRLIVHPTLEHVWLLNAACVYRNRWEEDLEAPQLRQLKEAGIWDGVEVVEATTNGWVDLADKDPGYPIVMLPVEAFALVVARAIARKRLNGVYVAALVNAQFDQAGNSWLVSFDVLAPDNLYGVDISLMETDRGANDPDRLHIHAAITISDVALSQIDALAVDEKIGWR